MLRHKLISNALVVMPEELRKIFTFYTEK